MKRYFKGIVLLLILLSFLYAKFILKVGLSPDPAPMLSHTAIAPVHPRYPKIYQALFENNASKLAILLKEKKTFFDREDEPLTDSMIGEALLKQKVSLPVLKVLVAHGFDLNRLKAVEEVSQRVIRELKSHGLTAKQIDKKYLPEKSQQLLKEKGLWKAYYNRYHRDEYYLVSLAERTPGSKVWELITWLLDHGYRSEPISLGYLLAVLMEKEDFPMVPQHIQTLQQHGMILTNKEKDNMLHSSYNAYKVLVALIGSGKMDDMRWVEPLIHAGMDPNESRNFFGYNATYLLCTGYTDTFFQKHLTGVQNLLHAGLKVEYKGLRECSYSRIKLLHPLDFGTQNRLVDKMAREIKEKPGFSLSAMLHNPIGAAILFYYIFLPVIIVIFILLLLKLSRYFRKKV